ncbi:hypothetical protein BDZ97DRAFT_57304 [Flammula alnicola]|nr:hypothetical protein BDZ97DRAFT_57304 [Flammula alnicola]
MGNFAFSAHYGKFWHMLTGVLLSVVSQYLQSRPPLAKLGPNYWNRHNNPRIRTSSKFGPWFTTMSGQCGEG